MVAIIQLNLQLLKKNDIDVVEAYLFGSYVNGNFNKDSDIDLALVISNLTDRLGTQTKLLKLGRDFDYLIEPHSFDKSEFNHQYPFTHEIFTTGIRVD
jgi:predicted nucleotidyltransferase